MADLTPTAYAKKLMQILYKDRETKLLRIDDYLSGDHDDPYFPASAGAEYRLLAARSVTNIMPLIVDTPTQMLYVDGVTPGREDAKEADETLPEWEHWQNSRLDSRQVAIHRSALAYGHAFTITEERGGVVQTKGLSPLRTSAAFSDPANDDTPRAMFTVVDWPSGDELGLARMWNETNEYEVRFRSISDTSDIKVKKIGPHGASSCPGTRFAAQIDLDGRTCGVIEPLIVLQNRLNQTVFDQLVVQTGGAFKVRTASGMAVPIKMKWDPVDSQMVPDLDENGQIQEEAIQVNALSFLHSEDPNTKFGVLDETPLDGYLAAAKEIVSQISAISQTPPVYLLGEVANLSAEALQAAEQNLVRKTLALRQLFGESWERVFRLAAELEGFTEAIDDYKVEVFWRDLDAQSVGSIADGLYKLFEIGAPRKGLFRMIPGMSENTLKKWETYRDEEKDEDPVLAQAAAISRTRSSRATAAAGAQGKTTPDAVP